MGRIRQQAVFAAVLSVLALAGCSDSNRNTRPSATAVTGGSEAEQPPLEVEYTTIQGNVVKGRVSNAEINIHEIVDGQVDASPFATVYSNSEGAFTLDVPSRELSDLIYIEVLGAADGSTRMNCDARECGLVGTLEGEDSNADGIIGLGETVYLSPDFKLSTVISKFKNADRIDVSVTPLTHFAVQQAVAEGGVDLESMERHMYQLATLMNMPVTLSQMRAVDPTEVGSEGEAAERPASGRGDAGAVEYGLLSAAVAGIARRNDQTIEAAIEALSLSLYNDDGSVNRESLLSLLEVALIEARRVAQQDSSLQSLITNLQLLIAQYRCDELDSEAASCDAVTLPVPPVVEENELETVKAFVADFRGWARNVVTESGPALSNFKSRIDHIDNVWEDDLKDLTSVLNDLLPGIAQTVSPSYRFCFYCENNGLPFYNTDGVKQLNIYGLQYLLHADGTMNITGTLRGVEVDVDLTLPDTFNWNRSHSIAISEGRLSKDNIDLVLLEGSRVQATYKESWYFPSLSEAINASLDVLPEADSLTIEANFFVRSNHRVVRTSQIGFEAGEAVPFGVLSPGAWSVVSNKAAGGSRSLRSPRLGHSRSARATANFETAGGRLVFDYAVESEPCCDFLRVYVDGNRVLTANGYQPGFRSASIYVAPGRHQVSWEYSKDGSVSSGQDAAWIDNIQFPALIGSAEFDELTARTVVNGQLSVTAHKLKGPWHTSYEGYLPSEVVINATLGSDFTLDESASGRDELSFRLAASFSDIAAFDPPEGLDESTLSKLGHYTVTGDTFELVLPHWQVTVSKEFAGVYRYESSDANGQIQSYLRVADTDEVHIAAGRLLENSGIGWHIVEPEQGLYITTLLGASPFGVYEESRFSPDGGDVFGYLVETFDPVETNEQFLSFSASLEATFAVDGLPQTTVGTTLDRESFNEGELDLYIELEGKRFNINSKYWLTPATYSADDVVSLEDREFSIRNQNGVQLHLAVEEQTSLDDGGKIELPLKGELVYNGSVYGTVERVKGVTLIRYIDGTGESLE